MKNRTGAVRSLFCALAVVFLAAAPASAATTVVDDFTAWLYGLFAPESGSNCSPESGSNISPESGRNLSPESGSDISPESGSNLTPESGSN